jgi:hypothetical protein
MELCLGFSETDWVVLRPKLVAGDSEAWEVAIGILRARIEERFLSCIEVLIGKRPSCTVLLSAHESAKWTPRQRWD